MNRSRTPCWAPCQTPEHQANHRELQQRFTRLDLAVVIFPETALSPQPPQRPFYNPAPRSHDKPFDVRCRGDDLDTPGAFGRTPRGKRLSALGSIGPDELQARLQRLEPDEQASCPCLV